MSKNNSFVGREYSPMYYNSVYNGSTIFDLKCNSSNSD